MENDERQIRDEIVKYFSQFTNKTIGEDTAINNDIGLAVSEYFDISLSFKKKFNIDLGSMDENGYFIDEIPYPLWHLFKWKSRSKNDVGKPPITVRHLIKVVQQGEWFDPS
jgi:hypothetical protein